MITEGIANVYEKIDFIPEDEEQRFAHFTLIGILAIHHHHHIEETLIFPKMEPEFTCPALQEHALFNDTLVELEDYLMAVLAFKKDSKGSPIPDSTKTKIPYDRNKIKALLERLSTPLFDHLSKEVEYLDPAKIKESGLSEQRLIDISASVERHVQSEIDVTVLPHVIGHVPPGTGFPPLPPFLTKFLVPYVFWWKHRKLWRYLPEFSN